MPFAKDSPTNKIIKESNSLTWYYPGARTVDNDKILAALGVDIENLFRSIESGDSSTLALFDYRAPGSRANWNVFLKSKGKRPLYPSDNSWNGDNLKYDTPEERAFLIKQLKKYVIPGLYSTRPMYIRGLYSNRATTLKDFEIFKDYIPQTFLTRLTKLYAQLKNVNKNTDRNVLTMSRDAVIAEATDDAAKLTGYINAFFDREKAQATNEYMKAAREYEREWILKQVPEAKNLAEKRTKKANIVEKVQGLNPVSRAVAKLAIRKNPVVVNENLTFKRLVLKNKRPSKEKYFE